MIRTPTLAKEGATVRFIQCRYTSLCVLQAADRPFGQFPLLNRLLVCRRWLPTPPPICRRGGGCRFAVANASAVGVLFEGSGWPLRQRSGRRQANHWPARHHWPPRANHSVRLAACLPIPAEQPLQAARQPPTAAVFGLCIYI